MIAVTGATGHLGNVLVRELVSRGEEVRAVVIPNDDLSSLEGLPVDLSVADVRDPAALRTAFSGCSLVFHLASMISISAGRRRELFDINVNGARNVAEACLELGVQRLVYTSSVHAFVEAPSDVCLVEEQAIDPDHVLGDYAASKATATLQMREAARRGLDVVIVYPAAIIGPFDFRPSELGQLILEVASGRLKAYVEGAYNFVDVRDVAAGVINAAGHGRRGEGYILCGEVASVREFIGLTAECCGVDPPRRKIPGGLARSVGIVAPFYYKVVGQRPLFTSYSIDVLRSNCLMSCQKARAELGFRSRPLARSVEDAVRWFRRMGRI